MKKLSVLHVGLFAYAEVGHGVAVRDRETGQRGWLRALEALSLVMKQWRTFVFLQLICVVIIVPLVFIEL